MPADLFAQALNGLAYGVLLFLLSVGLTLIFGMLDVVNLAHGSFYMLGAYAGLSLIAGTDNFWLALLLAPLAVGLIRAGVFDAEMTGGLGINIRRVFTAVFAFGAALGGLSGVIAGPIQSAHPSMGVTILIPALIVVVVGGLGSLKGSLAGSLLIGQAETFGKAWLPDSSMLIIYVVMATIMLVRPQGLFGRPLK